MKPRIDIHDAITIMLLALLAEKSKANVEDDEEEEDNES